MFIQQRKRGGSTSRAAPNGFVPSKAHIRPIEEYTSIPEIQVQLQSNAHLLAQTKSQSIRESLERRRVELEKRLDQLRVGVVEDGLRKVHINGVVNGATDGQPMDTDSEVYGHDQPRPVAAKQRVLVKEKEAFNNNAASSSKSHTKTVMFDHQEACRIEQEEAEQRMLRRQHLEEIEEEQSKEMAFLTSKHNNLSEAERHARILAFMNKRPSESDEEDEGDDMDMDDSEWGEGRMSDDEGEDSTAEDLLYNAELSSIIRVQHPEGWPGQSGGGV